jgi:hypothetical protein
VLHRPVETTGYSRRMQHRSELGSRASAVVRIADRIRKAVLSLDGRLAGDKRRPVKSRIPCNCEGTLPLGVRSARLLRSSLWYFSVQLSVEW